MLPNITLLQHFKACHILQVPSSIYDVNNPDWAPNQRLGYETTGCSSDEARARYERAKNRKKLRIDPDPETVEAVEVTDFVEPSTSQSTQTDITMADMEDFFQAKKDLASKIEENQMLSKANQDYVLDVCSLKERLKKVELTQASFEEDHQKVRYYTGLHSFGVFSSVFQLLEPYIQQTHRNKLNKFQQLLLTFMHLRLNLDFHDLAYRFGVCQTTSSKTFYVCLDIMFTVMKAFVIWPDRETIRMRMPPVFVEVFKKKVTVIIDCFEIRTEKPSNPVAQAQVFSNYKQHNTVKYLIGICPQGTITFISKAWGGKTSDKYITENCGILDKLIPHDLY